MKTCARCRESKPVAEFHKSKATSDGLTAYCKPCRKAYEAERLQRPGVYKAYRERNRNRYASTDPVERRARVRMRIYGVSREQADQIERTTHCDWCRVELTGGRGVRSKHVHHDHKSGEYVATLCGRCNSLEGWIAGVENLTPEEYLAVLTENIVSRNGRSN